ncbi:MAG: hypothetical protein DRH37_03770 [Deltaproteobacteria bacterium]|nr:MAG: hypothetical protein DRH37_03770 [Deltaproteobacteria bacterium]
MFLFKKDISEDKKQARVKNRRVHLANERTFLAWIRTSIGIMALGFIIEKLFLSHGIPGDRAIAFLGVFVVILGVGASLLATYRFLKTEREIAEDTFHPSITADILLAVLLSSIGVLLVIYFIIAA